MKFLDISGFTYFYNRLKEKLNAKADASDVSSSISNIQSSVSSEVSRATASENALSARMDTLFDGKQLIFHEDGSVTWTAVD